MNTMTYLEAGKAALAEEMRRDSRVWALGEDLGRGGVFGQYRGLAEEFGSARIVDAPISEAAIMGSAVGAALAGTRPVVEMRFSDFALCAVDELVNQAAKARYMFGGQSKVPLVAREPVGMWRSSAAQHSQSLESWYTHIPGLVVVMPSTPADNKGLLKSAIRCDDPVVYMEHKDLWAWTATSPAVTNTSCRSEWRTSSTRATTSPSWPGRKPCTRRWRRPARLPGPASRPKSSISAPSGHGTQRRSTPRSGRPAGSSSPTRQ